LLPVPFAEVASLPLSLSRIFIIARYKKAMRDGEKKKFYSLKMGRKTSPRLKVELTQGMITSDGEVSRLLDSDKHGFQSTRMLGL
jgi:hypothetical protein